MFNVRKHKSDLVILFATLGLMALGLIVIYAIGPMRANVLNSTYGTDYDSNFFFLGQLRPLGGHPFRKAPFFINPSSYLITLVLISVIAMGTSALVGRRIKHLNPVKMITEE